MRIDLVYIFFKSSCSYILKLQQNEQPRVLHVLNDAPESSNPEAAITVMANGLRITTLVSRIPSVKSESHKVYNFSFNKLFISLTKFNFLE